MNEKKSAFEQVNKTLYRPELPRLTQQLKEMKIIRLRRDKDLLASKLDIFSLENPCNQMNLKIERA